MSYFFHQVASLCSEHCYLIEFLLFGHMGLGFSVFLSECGFGFIRLYEFVAPFISCPR